MNRENIKQLIINLNKTQEELGKMYNWYDMDKIDALVAPLFDSMKLIVWLELWDRITWYVYEAQDIIKKHWYTKVSLQGKNYKIIDLESFLDYMDLWNA